MLNRLICIIAIALTFSGTGIAHAQSFDVGLEQFDDEDYEDAALTFYDVASRDPDANARNESLVYLAFTLERMGFWAPASFYYQVILEDGPGNRRWTNALEQLLNIQEKYRDHIFVDTLVDRNFDGRAFGKVLKGNKIDQVNYLLGALYLRQGKARRAQQFLEFVRPESRYYPDGQYLLGITSLSQGKAEAAAGHFQAVVQNIDPDTSDDDLLRVRQLALLAKARSAYGVGRYEDAIKGFGEIPRYSEFWFRALYEQAWAHYQEQKYGAALGALESVLSPYFAKRHVPEAYVIQGTSYFTYCQWDRVRRSVDRYKELYEPMKKQL
ncbi:MAG: tetratricopeptide repeat protein, partial [Myxococcota bacterium]